ncbi:hypothetical protein E4659_09650 [Dickeya dianthicola]|uniref:Uncharacterized protein n=1 Tax=Dickeya dianthicola TaxID=204039 RepID=A0AAX1C2J6_9GAMM|nr:hypothetical protein [Dickeya dianthicola]MCI4002139.1 hypothetical protein [Dickeya dianthicola]MCI4029299.1 hypothetical protein [Dickeya dianthicola]MCI4116178.1 hypothetical protein [Dickeya dianthicola]MCI4121009.1 hypothetical protein [Dickeya dianthicola]MCI4123873.1 hypothetical protein [Dickeya dianthicola]
MKYVNVGVIFVTSMLLMFSVIVEAKDENLFPGRSYLINESNYCADVYRKDKKAFSDNRMVIHIKDDSGDFIPANHPIYLNVDFYKPDNRDSRDATVPCHGKLYKKRSKHLKIDAPLAAIGTDDVR